MKYRVRFEGAAGAEPIEVDLPEVLPGAPARVTVNGRSLEVLLVTGIDGEAVLSIDGRNHLLRELPPLDIGASEGRPGAGSTQVRFLHGGRPVAASVESEADLLAARRAKVTDGPSRAFEVRSPLPGLVRRVLVAKGDVVDGETPLLTLEAMKMENEVRAGRAGRVAELFVEAGKLVNAGDALARIEPSVD
jgi:glutaconyl-CoA/methylmalonyl-CoA decarboxylase subunit gamma